MEEVVVKKELKNESTYGCLTVKGDVKSSSCSIGDRTSGKVLKEENAVKIEDFAVKSISADFSEFRKGLPPSCDEFVGAQSREKVDDEFHELHNEVKKDVESSAEAESTEEGVGELKKTVESSVEVESTEEETRKLKKNIISKSASWDNPNYKEAANESPHATGLAEQAAFIKINLNIPKNPLFQSDFEDAHDDVVNKANQHKNAGISSFAEETAVSQSNEDEIGVDSSLKESTQGDKAPKIEEESGFVFPSYESLLKEFEEETESETAPQSKAGMDDIFAAFEAEINSISRTQRSRHSSAAQPLAAAVAEVIDPDAECVRLTAQVFSSPFQVFQLSPDASDDVIKRQYKRISLLIHPDKCKHEKAGEAFQVLSKAYEQMQLPEQRLKYKNIIEVAKKRILKERQKENIKRKSLRMELLSVDEDEIDFKKAVAVMCDTIYNEQQERREYAEKCKAANENYEKEQERLLLQETLKKREDKRKWEETRDERVNSWRSYKQEIFNGKQMKTSAFPGLRHIKEQRPASAKPPPVNQTGKSGKQHAPLKKVLGIDESYKDTWR